MNLSILEKLLIPPTVRVWGQRKIIAPRLLANINLPSDAVCLEVGCGSGIGALLISQKFNCKKIVATDCNPQIIKEAKTNIRRAPTWAKDIPVDKIEFQSADAAHLPYDENTFDACFSFSVLHHVYDWQKAIFEVSRVLKPKGIYALEDYFVSEADLPKSVGLLINPSLPPIPFKEKKLFYCLKKAELTLSSYQRIGPFACLAQVRKERY